MAYIDFVNEDRFDEMEELSKSLFGAEDGYFEAVEVCPHCDSENVYPMWDVEVNGFVAVCKTCGKEIFLCDECTHAYDNPSMNCDWCKTKCGGKCFRGVTND